MTRALILLGITALACRDKDTPKPATPGSAAPIAVAPPRVAISPNPPAERPELPTFGSAAGGSGASVGDRFAAEEIDASWKSHTEASLRASYAKMHHPPSETECRTDMCRLTITGTEADLAASVDELQSLHDDAQTLMLTRPEPTKIVAYLQFERNAP
jgi:hypothetical protein